MWHEFAADTNDATLWDRLQRFSRRDSSFTVQEFTDPVGQWVRTDEEKAAALERKFFPRNSRPISNFHQKKLDDVQQWSTDHPSHKTQFQPITSDEINRTILEMRALGAPV